MDKVLRSSRAEFSRCRVEDEVTNGVLALCRNGRLSVVVRCHATFCDRIDLRSRQSVQVGQAQHELLEVAGECGILL